MQLGGQAGLVWVVEGVDTFEGPAGPSLDFNQGHPATAIRASHTSLLSLFHTHTRAASVQDFTGKRSCSSSTSNVTNSEQV